jgi:hypothetical protein
MILCLGIFFWSFKMKQVNQRVLAYDLSKTVPLSELEHIAGGQLPSSQNTVHKTQTLCAGFSYGGIASGRDMNVDVSMDF